MNLHESEGAKKIIEKYAEKTAVNLKWSGHQMNAFAPIYSRREMVRIGG